LIIIEEDGKMRKIFDFNKDGKTDIDDFKHIMLRYEIILVGGMLLILLPLLNMAGYLQLDSDTFWILAGVVISEEALLEIINERKKRKE